MITKLSTDWHVGVSRASGVTPVSQFELKQFIRDSLEKCLDDNDHLICGDLFNSFTIETSELLETYRILAAWLSKYGKHIAIMRGNHDYHESAGKVGSFDLLANILHMQFPAQVTVARDVTRWKNFVLVPHLPNNDLLDVAIENLGDVSDKFVVFHANLENKFAQRSDHSLDVTLRQVDALIDKGAKVLFGHEHISRTLRNGRAIVLGNTAPSSIADCLGNTHKCANVIEDGAITPITTWTAAGSFAEYEWNELADVDEKYQFIRVRGEASAAEAEAVINAISTLRRKHKAFVITNAVKIEGMAEMDGLSELNEDAIKSFNVLEALLAELTDREVATVKELME